MELQQAHELIVGMTGGGKTYYALARCRSWPGPVFYWNPQDQEIEPELGAWIRADRYNSVHQLFAGRARINYVPQWRIDHAIDELEVIVAHAMRPGRIWPAPLLLIIDEADQISPQGKLATPGHQVAQRGRKHHVFGWFVTQFPSALSKDVVRNCTTHTIFKCTYAAGYLSAHGLPGDQIAETLAAAPQYAFLQWTIDGRLAGPYRTDSQGRVTLTK